MELKLKNGMVLSGTFDQIRTAAALLGEPMPVPSAPHYVSTTDGRITMLSEMSTPHLNSAYLKTYEAHLRTLADEVAKQRADKKRTLEPSQLLTMSQELFLGNQPLTWLIAEMTNR
jgi:hypothetical protein